VDFADQINLEPLQIAFAFAIWVYSVASGKPLILLGIYLSMALWTRTVLIGPVATTWFWLAGIIAGMLVYLHKNRMIPKLPVRDRWIVAMIALWWFWIILLIMLYDGIDKRAFLRQMLVYVVVPIPVILISYRDLSSLRAFALSFLLTSLMGGWYAFAIIGVTLTDLVSDPLLSNTDIRQLGLSSYHYFARGFAISLFFSVAFFLESRRLVVRGLMVAAAALCIYMIFMSGSRQSLNSSVLGLAFYFLWSLAHRKTPKLRMSLLLASALVLGVYIYITAPSLIVRDDESGFLDALNIVSDRGGLWALGWQNFLTSPLWGTGFRFSVITHNILIGTLADQGIVGMVFFLALVAFAIRRGREAWLQDGSAPTAVWGVALTCLLLFAISHSMASGTVISVPHLYWPTALLWVLREPASRDARVDEPRLLRRPVRTRQPQLPAETAL
jgi:O-antigen ligase